MTGTDPIALGLLPEGFRDRLPPRAGAAMRLTGDMLEAIRPHGYDRVAPPLVEFEDSLVTRLAGAQAQDLVRLIDPLSQRTLALRPDITAQVGRIAATRMAHRPRPVRLAYAGPVLRVRGPQVGADRESLQLGAELIGSDHIRAVSEVLMVALEAVKASGAQDISVDLTLPSLVDELAADRWPVEDLPAVKAALDGKDQADLLAAGGQDYAFLIDAAGPVEPALAALRSAEMGAAFDARLDAAETLATLAGRYGTVSLDPTERLGFEYQSWAGFSLYIGGVPGEVGRGGTYTIRHPNGAAEPAVGFSLYVDPFVEAGLGGQDSPRIFLPPGTDKEVGAKLRAEGWVTVAALSEDDTAQANGCTHMWQGEAKAL
ncbi:MAG: ATP phosphoribosyltransferase regulatory subunit [Pacificimonas sp.]|jgi:ATP phosphoribosyltransferase regulatory subunit|nr:ATP phosphoribosyltransferase regulatory subunit [Pacificimonas sp.]